MLSLTGPVTAQEGPAPVHTSILLIDSDEAFSQSIIGQKIAREIEEESRALSAENRQIEADLIEEERRLTDLRASLPPEEFRALADAFDEKVRRIRSEQDAKARALGQKGDAGRRAFLSEARPVLEDIMRETGAVAILEIRDIFFGAEAANITAEVIRRLNASASGDGSTEDSVPAPPAATDPDASDPDTTDPDASDPGAAEPAPARP